MEKYFVLKVFLEATTQKMLNIIVGHGKIFYFACIMLCTYAKYFATWKKLEKKKNNPTFSTTKEFIS